MTQLVLDVGRDAEGRLAGTIRSEGRAPTGFDGVIELLAAVEELVDSTHDADADEGGAR